MDINQNSKYDHECAIVHYATSKAASLLDTLRLADTMEASIVPKNNVVRPTAHLKFATFANKLARRNMIYVVQKSMPYVSTCDKNLGLILNQLDNLMQRISHYIMPLEEDEKWKIGEVDFYLLREECLVTLKISEPEESGGVWACPDSDYKDIISKIRQLTMAFDLMYEQVYINILSGLPAVAETRTVGVQSSL